MKKSEFKKLLKPIVKECVRESLLESGLLSGVISEVVRDLNLGVTAEREVLKKEVPRRSISRDLVKEQAVENRRKLMEAVSADAFGGVDIFEGVTPMGTQASPSEHGASPLGGIGASDAGLDISGIINVGGKKWKALMG
jgi:hypothetical protein